MTLGWMPMWNLENLKTVVPILSNSHVRSWRWSLSLLLKDRRKNVGPYILEKCSKTWSFWISDVWIWVFFVQRLIWWLCSRTAVRPVQVNDLLILILNIAKIWAALCMSKSKYWKLTNFDYCFRWGYSELYDNWTGALRILILTPRGRWW